MVAAKLAVSRKKENFFESRCKISALVPAKNNLKTRIGKSVKKGYLAR